MYTGSVLHQDNSTKVEDSPVETSYQTSAYTDRRHCLRAAGSGIVEPRP